MLKTNFIKLLLGNLLVLLVLLVVVEVVLRLLNVGFGNTPLNPDPVFHHVHPNDYRYVSYSSTGEYEGYEVYFDEKGRVASPEGNSGADKPGKRAAFLGDSFTESLQVPFDSSFIALLDRAAPEYATENYGVASYSPSLHYLTAKHKLLNGPAPPDKVFIMIYSNDVEDDRTYLKDAVHGTSGELEAINGGKPDRLVVLMRKSYLVRLLRKTLITIQYALDRERAESVAAAGVVGDYIEEIPTWEGSESADYTLRTVRLLESSGSEVYLTVVPSKYCHFNHNYDLEELSEKVEKWAATHDVRFIDLTAPFRLWREQNPDGKLFFEKDIHFNETGHAVVAATLLPYLRN